MAQEKQKAESPGATIGLDEIRKGIDSVDEQLVALLKERAKWVHQVGLVKRLGDSPIFAPVRERDLLEKVHRLNGGVLNDRALEAIYREIMSCSFELEGGLSIAYLGPEGTWSHQAALKQFGSSVTLMPMDNFSLIFRAVEYGKADYGVVPVENSTEGSVTAAMDCFVESPLKICAQLPLHIRNALLCAGPREGITTIYSHPQVLGQTRNWLMQHFPKAALVPTASTTKAAEIARDQASQGAAALGCPLAAKLCGLNILEEDIQDIAANTTRFVVIGKQDTPPSGKDKTSLLLRVHNRPGALADVTACLNSRGINLTRIESRPSRSTNWEYIFYIDVEGHSLVSPLKEALAELERHCSLLKVLGSYPDTLAD